MARTTSCDQVHRRAARAGILRQPAAARAHRHAADAARHRRHHRHRHLRAHRRRRRPATPARRCRCRSSSPGLGCTFAGLCYAEFAAMIPVSGSAYSYSYATLGEVVAWFIGWNLVLEYLFAVATVSVGWSGYVVSLLDQLHLHIPARALARAARSGRGRAAPACAPARSSTCRRCSSWLRSPPSATSASSSRPSFNSVIVTIKVTVVVLFIVFGVSYINTANWHPFIPPQHRAPGAVYGPSGILAASGIIFFAYIGFDAVSTAAQEAKNPQRDMPIGILASLVDLHDPVRAGLRRAHRHGALQASSTSPAPVALALDKYAGAALAAEFRSSSARSPA